MVDRKASRRLCPRCITFSMTCIIVCTILLGMSYVYLDIYGQGYGYIPPKHDRLVAKQPGTGAKNVSKSQPVHQIPSNDVSRNTVLPKQHASLASPSRAKKSDDLGDVNKVRLPGKDVCTVLLPEERTLSERRDCLREKCDSMNRTMVTEDKLAQYIRNKTRKMQLLVNEKHKVLYCPLAKVSSTNMLRVMHFLEFGGSQTSLAKIGQGGARHSPYTMLGNFSVQEIHDILSTYTKVIVTREPFERLVSAYRDGRCSKHRNFTEFLDNVLKFLHGKKNINRHVDTFMHRCLPCYIEYDFLSTTKTLEKDMNSLMMQLGFSHVHFPKRNETNYLHPTSAEAAQELYTTAPAALVDRIWKAYHSDYDLFGYPHPADIYTSWKQ